MKDKIADTLNFILVIWFSIMFTIFTYANDTNKMIWYGVWLLVEIIIFTKRRV